MNEWIRNERSASSDVPSFLTGSETAERIRAFDWSTTSLGPIASWPRSLRTVASAVQASGFPMIALWGPDLVQIYNDGYRRIMGSKHPSGLGQTTRECWPEVWHINGPIYADVLSGKSATFEDALYPIDRDGVREEAWFTLSYSPIRDDTDAIAGVLVTVFETTGRMLAERRVAADTARQRRLFEQAPGFIAISRGPEHVYEFGNESYARLVGRRDFVGKSVREALPDIEGQGFYELLDGVYATGQAHVAKGVPVRMRRTPGGGLEERFVDFIYEAVTDEAGRVTGIFTQGHDITDAHLAQEVLRENEAFTRQILESSTDCIKVLDLDANLLFMSEGGKRVMEVADFGTIAGCPWTDFWHDEGNVEAKAAVEAARSGGEGSFQGQAYTMAGNLRHWDVHVTPILDLAGRPERLLSIARDVTDQKVAERQRADLANELSHRMKNTLAMVQAIVTQTLRQVDNVDDAAAAISGRLAALARAQDILTFKSVVSADIHDVVLGALTPHRTGENQYGIFGPPVELSSQQGLGLSLALHELATNAAKYGAMSNANGRVAIEWTVSTEGAFAFTWTESGGPPVATPSRVGFGSRLVERIVAPYFGGTSKIVFDPAGVRFRLEGSLGHSEA